MSPLPQASAQALLHSQQLARMIIEEIAAGGGWISFARYMELALYTPGLGYYSAGAEKFGVAGDFVTAPEMSPLFARCLARQVSQALSITSGSILELGAGTGKFACDLLRELEAQNKAPEHYFILEVSGELQSRQQALIGMLPKKLAQCVRWIDKLPRHFAGLVFANEVFDALPVHVVAWHSQGIYECGVTYADGKFCWKERPLAKGELFNLASSLQVPVDYVSEIHLAACGLMRSLAALLDRGVILVLDYGFGAAEYYHPQRNLGTLMCHYRQQAHDDPFYLPGLQDITSHVNFSSIIESAGDLRLLGYTTQANFLVNCGITEILGKTAPDDAAYLPLVSAAQKLLSPAEMGELFKALALGKGVSQQLIGFMSGDKSRLL
ncbi:MAG: class I SAM-dependent methyltransferase [Burkholderiales bacterium]